MPLPKIYTTKEAAKFLHKGLNFIYDAMRAGTLPHGRMGRSYFIREDALLKFMNDACQTGINQDGTVRKC